MYVQKNELYQSCKLPLNKAFPNYFLTDIYNTKNVKIKTNFKNLLFIIILLMKVFFFIFSPRDVKFELVVLYELLSHRIVIRT